MKTEIKKYDYNGFEIEFKTIDNELYANATSMAKPFPEKNLSTWTNAKSTIEYVSVLKAKYSTIKNFIVVKNGGKDRGTWIHQRLILKLAGFLNTEFEVQCDEWVAELLQTGSVSLNKLSAKEKRAAKLLKEGKSPDFIESRIEGVERRNAFTSTLKYHGVTGQGYGICTRAIYSPLFGGDGSTGFIKEKKQITGEVRDNLSKTELLAISLVESLSEDKIKAEEAKGNVQCAEICRTVSTTIARSIVASRKLL